MEARESLTVDPAAYRRWLSAPSHVGLVLRSVSPDGLTASWSKPGDAWAKPHELIVERPGGVITVTPIDGGVPNLLAISSNAQVAVAGDGITQARPPWRLLLLDLRFRQGMVHDFARSLTVCPLAELVMVSISGSGGLVAFGSFRQIQVVEIPSGRSVYTGTGQFPRLSPDGTRLAYIDKDRLYLRSLSSGTAEELLSGTRVTGIGTWSPNGRFLPAGAWTKLLALDKRQIIIDTTTGSFGAVDVLQEGDAGTNYGWISTRLMAR
jgi:hypothetical protein